VIYLLPSGAARRHLYCLSLRTGRLYFSEHILDLLH
jgi:hypothetical protein